MNLYTFKDAATSKRSSLANELENLDDGDEDDVGEGQTREARGAVDGEEDAGGEKFNDAGEVIMPFNLKDERDEGHFDEGGNYVWKKEHEEPDAWLANMNEAEMENAIGEAAAALKRKNDALTRLDKEEAVVQDRETLKGELLNILKPGEAIPAALRRLGGGKQVRSKGWKKGPQAAPAADRELFSKLTDIADALIVLGFTNIYDLQYDSLDAILSTWEYKGQDGQIYGPFQGNQIVKWMQQGFFGPGVEMRKVAGAPQRQNDAADEQASKRIRFEETKREAAPVSNHEDLMNDLDDDSDSDPEATAMMGGRKPPAAVNRNTAERPAPFSVSYGPWVNSNSLDFGDVDGQEDEGSEGEQGTA